MVMALYLRGCSAKKASSRTVLIVSPRLVGSILSACTHMGREGASRTWLGECITRTTVYSLMQWRAHLKVNSLDSREVHLIILFLLTEWMMWHINTHVYTYMYCMVYVQSCISIKLNMFMNAWSWTCSIYRCKTQTMCHVNTCTCTMHYSWIRQGLTNYVHV